MATAALLTRMSQWPNSASMCSTIAAYSEPLLTSAPIAVAVAPAWLMPSTTLSAGPGVWLWLTTTVAPAVASAAAIASPIPVAAPVTRATFPARDAAGALLMTRPPGAPGAAAAAGHPGLVAGGSFEPVVEVDLGSLAEVRGEPAFAAQPSQLARSRPRDHEPVAADHLALDGPGVLQQERARTARDRAGDPLDPDEARRAVRPRGLQELDDAIPGDVAGEALFHVDSGQGRA